MFDSIYFEVDIKYLERI